MALNPYPHKVLGRFLPAAATAVVIAGCGVIGGKATSPTTTTTVRPTVAVGALDELLLSPTDVGTAMGAAGMSVKQTDSKMYDDNTDIPDAACRNSSPADTSVYAGSGWTAVRVQYLRDDGESAATVALLEVTARPSI